MCALSIENMENRISLSYANKQTKKPALVHQPTKHLQSTEKEMFLGQNLTANASIYRHHNKRQDSKRGKH